MKSESGLEFWQEKEDEPPLTRIANFRCLVRELSKHQLYEVVRFATCFWDIYRFSPGILRGVALRYNWLWFSLRLPAWCSSGNAIIAEKHG